MLCPTCKADTIPFSRVWLRAGLGSFRCPACHGQSRVKRSSGLILVSMALGSLPAITLFTTRSPWAAAGVVVVVLGVDAWLDRRYRVLEQIVPPEEPRK